MKRQKNLRQKGLTTPLSFLDKFFLFLDLSLISCIIFLLFVQETDQYILLAVTAGHSQLLHILFQSFGDNNFVKKAICDATMLMLITTMCTILILRK